MLHQLHRRHVLLVVAAPAEAQAVLRGLGAGDLHPLAPPAWTISQPMAGIDLLSTGIGKSNAAGAVGRFLDPLRHSLVLNIGIGGALPIGDEQGAADLGSIHIASACIFADEGLETPQGFLDCASIGFPLGAFPGNAVPVDAEVCKALAPLGTVSRIATVSTCSGTDQQAQRTAQRTSAAVEAMEGAAIALVAHRLGTPMAEVRVVSNTTGDRSGQRWDVRAALDRITHVVGQVFAQTPPIR